MDIHTLVVVVFVSAENNDHHDYRIEKDDKKVDILERVEQAEIFSLHKKHQQKQKFRNGLYRQLSW